MSLWYCGKRGRTGMKWTGQLRLVVGFTVCRKFKDGG